MPFALVLQNKYSGLAMIKSVISWYYTWYNNTIILYYQMTWFTELNMTISMSELPKNYSIDERNAAPESLYLPGKMPQSWLFTYPHKRGIVWRTFDCTPLHSCWSWTIDQEVYNTVNWHTHTNKQQVNRSIRTTE